MTIERRIRLIGGEKDEAGVLTATLRSEKCLITFAYRGRTIETEATDFFEALCNIRVRLEGDGLMPFCYGSSLNVFPSAMGRYMGLGLKACLLTIGKHAADLVEIFDDGPDVVPVSVARQREFFNEWLRGPRV